MKSLQMQSVPHMRGDEPTNLEARLEAINETLGIIEKKEIKETKLEG